MDIVRPDSKRCRAVYEKGFYSWFGLYLRAMEDPNLPQACFEIQSILQEQPYFPSDLDLKKKYGSLYVTGTSVLGASLQGPCRLPVIEKQKEPDFAVSANNPVPLHLSSDPTPSFKGWFNTEEIHLSLC